MSRFRRQWYLRRSGPDTPRRLENLYYYCHYLVPRMIAAAAAAAVVVVQEEEVVDKPDPMIILAESNR